MMVLVAFELGYLATVALNHLLARQVIGEDAVLDDDTELGFETEQAMTAMLVGYCVDHGRMCHLCGTRAEHC